MGYSGFPKNRGSNGVATAIEIAQKWLNTNEKGKRFALTNFSCLANTGYSVFLTRYGDVPL
jgi:hypothetical protein